MKAYCPIAGAECEADEIVHLSFGRIVRCRPSGLIRTFPPRSEADLAALHSAPEYFEHPYFKARRDVGSDDLLKKHIQTFESIASGDPLSGLRLLDIGCDTGAFIKVGRDEFGLKVTGLEVSERSARIGREEHGLDIIVGQLRPSPFEPESFDLVTLLDVIEHLSDPRAELAEIHRILAPGGRLYIVTADHDALINSIGLAFYKLLGRFSRPVLEKLYIPYHEYYFTKPTLAELLERAGFKVYRHDSFEFPLSEFGHGWHYKLALRFIFALQALLGRQTLQGVIAVKE